MALKCKENVARTRGDGGNLRIFAFSMSCFPNKACILSKMSCSEKRYSSERKCWEDENETKPEVWERNSGWDRHFKSFSLRSYLREVVALANSKKNRNIKAYNVNFISMARSTDFCFKTTYVSMVLRFRSIVCCFQCFVRGSSPFGKVVSHKTPLPLGNYCP